jgi:glucokinase
VVEVIGVDVGGTKIAVGIVDVDTGAVRSVERSPTAPWRGGQAVLRNVTALVGEVSADRSVGIGVSLPELVDQRGNVLSDVTVDWTSADLQRALGSSGPVILASDVRAAALAEARFGAGDDLASFVYLSVGTGVSSTFVLDGKPWPGVNGCAVVAASGGRSLTCPDCGLKFDEVPENIASGAGVSSAYGRRTGRNGVDTREVLQRAGLGDTDAQAAIAAGGHELGAIAARIVDLLDPQALVVGGGLGLAQGLYREAFESSLRSHIWADCARNVPVLDSRVGELAPLIGAALYFDDARRDGDLTARGQLEDL